MDFTQCPKYDCTSQAKVEEYIEKRVDNQIKWLDKHSTRARMSHRFLQAVTFTSAAFIPFLASLVEGNPNLTILISILALAIVISESFDRLFNNREKWIKYRTSCEALKREKNLFINKADRYSNIEPSGQFQAFVTEIENLIASEGRDWQSSKITVSGE